MADLGAWPSDLATWARAIGFVLGQVPSLRVIPLLEITAVFEVWQNYAGYRRNPVSDALIAQCDEWLADIESRHDAQVAGRRRLLPWATLDTEARLVQRSLRQLLMEAAKTAPDRVTEYLKRLLSSAIPVRDRLARVIENAFILAQTHPKLLVEIALAHFREDLPEEVFARKSSGGDQASGQAHDSKASFDGHGRIAPQEFSDRVWDELSVYPVSARDFPASPLGEPFHSLFQKAPVEALRLLRELSHHAITAWRQVQRLERRATPIALEISFPWGTQRFWGSSREFRRVWR